MPHSAPLRDMDMIAAGTPTTITACTTAVLTTDDITKTHTADAIDTARHAICISVHATTVRPAGGAKQHPVTDRS